jgi:hypothetical protein
MSKFGETGKKLQDLLESFCQIKGQWWCTKEYDRFKLLSFNRDVNHAKKIIQNIKKDGYHPTPATIIFRDGDLWVKAGQGRLEACRELGLPFYFTVDMVNKDDGFDLVKAETATDPWDLNDYTKAHSDLGKETHKMVQEATEYSKVVYKNKEISIGASQILHLITDITPGAGFYRGDSAVANAYKSGDLKITKDQLEAAKKKIDLLKQAAVYVGGQYGRREFQRAFDVLRSQKKFKMKTFLARLESNAEMLVGCSGYIDFGETLTAIYNRNTKDGYRITDLNWKEIARAQKRKMSGAV